MDKKLSFLFVLVVSVVDAAVLVAGRRTPRSVRRDKSRDEKSGPKGLDQPTETLVLNHGQ